MTLRPALTRVCTGSAIAFSLLSAAVIAGVRPLYLLDATISAAAHTFALAHPAWLATMAAVTQAGSTAVIGPLAAIGCIVLLSFGRWQSALFVAVGLLVPIGLRLAVVAAIARPRPVDRLADAANYSYPSGHSTASAAAALVLALVCVPLLARRWQRVLLIAVAAAWAILVGLSRVALVVHWPTDVLGAWLFVATLVPLVALVQLHLSARTAQSVA